MQATLQPLSNTAAAIHILSDLLFSGSALSLHHFAAQLAVIGLETDDTKRAEA